MYAWVEHESTETEKNVGGSTTNKTTYTYKKEWTTNPEPSSSLEYPEGHSNPDMPIKSASFTVQSASIGVYAIDPSTIEMPSASEIALSSDNAGDDDRMRLSGNFLFMGRGSPGSPQLGDIRISYTGVRGGQDVTAFGRQQASKLVPYVTPNQDRLYRIFQGDRESAIKQMDTEYRVIGWILRLVGFLMMWIGLCLCVGPMNAVLDVLPFLGSAGRFVVGLVALPIALVFSIITIVTSMLAHNPLALIVLLALIIGGVVAWSRMRRPSAGPAAA
jgi:hypothetical protein